MLFRFSHVHRCQGLSVGASWQVELHAFKQEFVDAAEAYAYTDHDEVMKIAKDPRLRETSSNILQPLLRFLGLRQDLLSRYGSLWSVLEYVSCLGHVLGGRGAAVIRDDNEQKFCVILIDPHYHRKRPWMSWARNSTGFLFWCSHMWGTTTSRCIRTLGCDLF